MIWFLEEENKYRPEVDLLYPLKQTEGRRNVQIYLSRLEEINGRHAEFFIVIHDGHSRCYYIPYSYITTNILPRARIRVRRNDPRQKYLTVDEKRKSKHIFSFGLDLTGKPLVCNLSQYYNLIETPEDVPRIIDQLRPSTSIPFQIGTGPFILNTYEMEKYGLDIKLLSQGRIDQEFIKNIINNNYEWEIQDGRLVLTHPEDIAGKDDIIRFYNELISTGLIDTQHIMRTTEYRPYQQALREASIANYSCRCAMCDVDIRRALITSHIRPASIDITNRTNLSNVLLLCGLHDALFDAFLISVQPDYRIAISSNLTSSSELIEEWVFDLEGDEISLPNKYIPDPKFLEWHCSKTIGH